MASIYKNAPLASASFEARFAGDLSIETKRDLFQKAIQYTYPKLYVPNADPEKAPSLQHYQFRKEDGSAVVGLAVNSFMYTSRHYPGFPNFKKELEEAWKIFSDLYDIPSFNRVGLRYINRLPLIRDERHSIPLSKLVTAKLSLASGVSSDVLYDLGLTVVCETPRGRFRIMMGNEEGEKGLEILLLDLDFFRLGPIAKEDRIAFIDEAHEQIEAAFLELISKEFRDIMEGSNQ